MGRLRGSRQGQGNTPLVLGSRTWLFFSDFKDRITMLVLDNAVIINKITRRRNQNYNAEEITYQARIDPEQIPPRLQATPLVPAVEAVRSLI
ncbi:hypothetical protein AVEN_91284-1 [Araneus ventricosus]|uniref:Uncharacterized protein n=1 Tax=Araneus ventricosus TaxID=182803 RepID=A0A4Y2EPQ2_ARAVE|nr:hypothetical protein AVEN_91284-1 [Araneus ventricosus]